MGIIGCKVDFFYNQNEIQEEVKMDKNNDNILKKICIEFNNSTNQDQYKTNYNYETRNYGIEKHDDITEFANFEKNYKKNKNSFKVKSNKGKKIFGLKKNRGEIDNNDELVIITPGKDNNIFLESFNNDITDEYTIKNETAVYNNENNDMKTNNLNEIKEEEKNNKEKKNNIIIINNQDINKENVKDNNNKNKKKLRKSFYNNDKKVQKINNNNNSKSFIMKKKLLSKKLNLNNPLQKSEETNNNNISERNNNIETEMNNINNNAQKEKSKNKSLPNYKKKKNTKINNIKENNIKIDNNSNNYNKINNNRSYNNFNYLKNNYFYPLYSSFKLSNFINNSKNQKTSTLDQNIQLKNILLHQLPLIKKEEILPNIERKTYQEDIFPIKNQNIPNNNKILEREYYNQIYTGKNKYFLFNNNNQIMDQLNDIYNVLYTRNNFLNYNQKNYKKSKSPGNSYDNQIFKRDTNFHVRNKSFSNNYNYTMNNDNNNNNSFFSLFNNSTNLSINFINKANKFTQPSDVFKKSLSYVNKKYENKNNNNNNYRYKQNNNIGNPFLNYNNFDKNHYSGKKNTKNKTYLKKVKPKLSNSKTFNNIMNISDINNINILSQQYRDLIEVYMPQKEGITLIDNEIINNFIGNKYILSYKKINNFDTQKILYDGELYKVIDNMENENKDKDNKYKLLPRYFQITKNCFRYYNDMNEAINEKDKPLVQFDIRFIQNLEIIENNFLEKYTINNKNVEIVFCIYIKQNNDFFVFAHNNKKIGKTVINIILFLIRYYEDRQ